MYLAYAKAKDLKEFTWYTFEGPRKVQLGMDKEYNQRHPLVVQPSELFGVKRVARGAGAGNYQIVLGVALHVLFRNVPMSQIKRVEKYLKPYKGKTPEHNQVLDSKRSKKVSIREKESSDKQKDEFFKPAGTIRETASYSRENYQWRKLKVPRTLIKSLKQGKSKGQLQEGEVFGLRYMTKTRGGFIIMPDDQRVNIDHNTYTALVTGSRILPTSQQQKGIVLLSEIKAKIPKQTRNRKPKEENIVPRSGVAENKRINRDIKRDISLDVSDVGDFEDDEVPDHRAPALSQLPKSHTPMFVLKEGKIIRSAKNPSNEYVISGSKDYGDYTEFSVYNVDTEETKLLRIPNNTDMSRQKIVSILGQADRLLHAQAKRALHKAVKDNKFTVGTIHD